VVERIELVSGQILGTTEMVADQVLGFPDYLKREPRHRFDHLLREDLELEKESIRMHMNRSKRAATLSDLVETTSAWGSYCWTAVGCSVVAATGGGVAALLAW